MLLLFLIGACLVEASHKIPLYGNFSAIFMYYMNISIGDGVDGEVSSYTVTFDTGSSDLLVPSMACTVCVGNRTTFYNASTGSGTWLHCPPSSSQFYRCSRCINDTLCSNTAVFGGSLTEKAVLANDVVRVPGTAGADCWVRANFGGIYSIDMDRRRLSRLGHHRRRRFPSGVPYSSQMPFYPDGLAGVAFQSLSMSNSTPIIYELMDQLGLSRRFTMSLNKVGGFVDVGEAYEQGERTRYARLLPNRHGVFDFYRFSLIDLKIMGKSIGVKPVVYNQVASIVDSGTPQVNIPVAAFAAFRIHFTQLCEKNKREKWEGVCVNLKAPNETLFDGACYSLSAAAIRQFPLISFFLQSSNDEEETVEVVYSPEFYLQYSYQCNQGEVALALTSPGDNFTVLGATHLQQHFVSFDMINSRIGFTKK